MQLPNIPLVVLDTETTGFIPKVNRVIEYAHVVYRDGKEVDTYEELYNIPAEIPGVVQIITRIKPDHLEGKRTFDDARDEIVKRMGEDTIIVGQNVSFDIRMLGGEGIDLKDRPWIDTSMLASLVFPELESYSLGYMSSVLNLNHEPVHRAMGDVHATLEMLSKCWERLLELPQEMVLDIKATMSKSSPGYRILFDALPTGEATEKPEWMTMPTPKKVPPSMRKITLNKPEVGTVDMIEEPLDPAFLQTVLNAAAADTSTVHWIAVKNLTATAKRLHIPEGVRVLQPPFLLLDKAETEELRKADTYTADEATLLTKLDWYDPDVYDDAPVHGGEKAVWNGKLACTEDSAVYTKQFTDLPSVMLIDHRQLLAFIKDPEHAGHGALSSDAHIIIDDASMLEDTASKAYGSYCALNDLRAASEGHGGLTKFTDLLQLWIEKTRNEQDTRYLAHNDIHSSEAAALREQIATLKDDDTLRPQTHKQLEAALACLEEDALKRITWIETRQDGSQTLHSVPESVAEILQAGLFEKYAVSLLIPPRSAETLQEAVHRGVKTAINTAIPRVQSGLDVSFPVGLTGRKVLSDPPEGKTILLSGSRRIIEEYFVKFTEDLEAQGVTLLCQNFSGGMGRMQAEFLAADAPTVWVLTPWMFEGVALPPGSVDHLFVDALPFDNPSQPVFGKRAEHFDNGFLGYSMPRLLHRLFRVLRTFARIATGTADVTVIDNRIEEKRYGKTVKQYISLCSENIDEPKEGGVVQSDYPENWQMNLF